MPWFCPYWKWTNLCIEVFRHANQFRVGELCRLFVVWRNPFFLWSKSWAFSSVSGKRAEMPFDILPTTRLTWRVCVPAHSQVLARMRGKGWLMLLPMGVSRVVTASAQGKIHWTAWGKEMPQICSGFSSKSWWDCVCVLGCGKNELLHVSSPQQQGL